MIEHAMAAWAAYAKAVGGKTFDGKPLPAWDELGPLQKRGWVEACEAVILRLATL